MRPSRRALLRRVRSWISVYTARARLVLGKSSRKLIAQLVGNCDMCRRRALVHGVELRLDLVVMLGEGARGALRALGILAHRGERHLAEFQRRVPRLAL